MNIVELNQNEISAVNGGGLGTQIVGAVGFCVGIAIDTVLIASMARERIGHGAHRRLRPMTTLFLATYAAAAVAIAWAGSAIGATVGAAIESLTE